jgi:hypothetical protein
LTRAGRGSGSIDRSALPAGHAETVRANNEDRIAHDVTLEPGTVKRDPVRDRLHDLRNLFGVVTSGTHLLADAGASIDAR